MSARLDPKLLIARDEVVAAPAERACADSSFELPPAIYGAMAALFMGFLAVMTVGFAHPNLVVPMSVNVVFVAMFFAVPAVMVKSAPEAGRRTLRWSELMERGIRIEHGHSSGGEAAILALILPALVLFWGVAVVTIAALV